jgi:hypothetical protein
MPFPVELLRFFDRTAPAGTQSRPPVREAEDTAIAPSATVPQLPGAAVPANQPANQPAILPAGTAVTEPLTAAEKAPAVR